MYRRYGGIREWIQEEHKMKQELTMKQFLEEYEDEFREFAFETIREYAKDYFDGYTVRSEEDIDEVFENNREELLIQFLDEKELKILKVSKQDLDDICVVCGVYVVEGKHVCNNCRSRGDAYEE